MCVAPGSQPPATEGNHAASDASAEGSCITESESMRATLSLIRREFAAYFTGPIGYVALFGFLTLTGLLFWIVVGLLTEKGPRGVEYPMQVMLGGADNPEWALVAGVLFWGLF